MPVRSVKVKMILRRGADGEQLRQSLWLTHSVVNGAVAEIERILLLCRGRGYHTGEDEVVSADEVRGAALSLAREIQEQNGKPGAGTDEDVLAGLQSLYESLVPSVMLDEAGKPREGSAQAAGGFASPMMDPNSEGFQSVFDKILDPPPAWIVQMEQEIDGWQEQSVAWLETAESDRLQRASGSPPAWVRRLRAGQPWQDAFVADQVKKRKETTGVPLLIRRLKTELGLLPLLRPPITSQLDGDRSGLTPWDRLALRLAVAHLLSWESWNHRAASEHERVRQRVEKQGTQIEPMGELIEEFRQYETDRHENLRRVALVDDSAPFRIGVRMIRNWDRVRQAWLGDDRTSQAARLRTITDLQTKLGNRFGDPDLFRWMAEDGRERLWEPQDPLPLLARFNALERLLARKKDHAVFTPPDARLHPKWTGYEAPGGANLRNYGLTIEQAGLTVTLRLLSIGDDGLQEEPVEIPLAPSAQLDAPSWRGEGRRDRRLVFRSANQEFSAQLGGSEILFHRRHLENREAAGLADGDVGSVWFKLVLDVDSQAPADWLDGHGRVAVPPTVHHFNTALANRSRHTADLGPGLRVLSVDLGLRTFAACSVFELVEGKPPKGLAYLADRDKDLWAQHERSFLLTLPGEKADGEQAAGRRAAYEELGSLRRGLGLLKSILTASIEESVERQRQTVEEFRNRETQQETTGTTPLIEPAQLAELESTIDTNPSTWQSKADEIYRAVETRLGEQIGQWRKRTRPRATDQADRLERRAYAGGKSAWPLEYLDNVRRFLIGWSLHGRQYGQINRLDRERRGTFAAGLLTHINALKQDRVKTGSDLIVQAARGFVPGEHKGWVRQYAPCRLILFEDLARYLFRKDRSRAENSRLMKWSHRNIVAETEMQAEVYGLVVRKIGAGYSSRFHARSGAPGYRSRVLTAADLESPWMIRQLQGLADQLHIPVDQFTPGTRVPWEGGEEFVSLTPDGKSVVIHADINAAQNLQRRFWTRHGDAYRIMAMEVKHGALTAWYPDSQGVRLRGSLSTVVGDDGYARLVPADDGDGWVLEKVTRAQWRRATGTQATDSGEEAVDELDLQMADATGDEAALERGAGRRAFFRDPSGLVLREDRWYEAKVYWGQVRHWTAVSLGLVDGLL
ncbi:MAG: type V CRISPR-associated protein Cas12b [Planctomycetes bacterium]|nr:type V CRISPR-associated protein Cas12b [Planctomycetota bacterium]